MKKQVVAKPEETRIEVTNENAARLTVGLLDIVTNQNRKIIDLLGNVVGLLGKIPARDIDSK